MWLKKNMYSKLQTDVKFELEPLDTGALQEKYSAFE